MTDEHAEIAARLAAATPGPWFRDDERVAAAEAEVATLREALQDIGHELLRAEAHCPCGARRESPSTHPHVIDCPIGNAIARFESLATPTATAGEGEPNDG